MRIMMSAAGSPQAVGIIRHLKQLGHYVIGHDSCEWGAGAGFCDEWHVSPPVKKEMDYEDFVIDSKFDLYLPFLDEELLLSIAGDRRRVISPYATLSIFTSKIKQQAALEKAGLPVAPFTRIVIKPEFGRGGKGISYAGGQRFIDGDEYTVDCLCHHDGPMLFAVPRQRIAVAGGVSTIGKIDMDQDIIELARCVCDMFKFIGPINIQFIRERGTGKFWIIEVNPRLSGSCMFTVLAGWDILNDTVRLFEGKPFVPPERVNEVHVRRYYTETIA